ncbi:MAG: hypothetical protein EXR21_06630 [Flavobacteriaceae bacterium]|nr:hypothetical protein [Flavobacteriaceae bacterium]
MKLIINLLALSLTFSLESKAQTVYEDFEDWDTVPYPNPKGWFSSNAYSVFGGNPIGITRCDTAKSGSYALRIESKRNNLSSSYIPGWVFNGNIDSAFKPHFGQPCNIKPTNMNFYFQYYPVNDDTAGGYVLFTKWNTAKQKRDTLGSGGFSLEDYTPGFSLASAGIYYLPGNEVPDSVVIAFVSGIHQDSGSVLIVDKVEFKGSLIGVPELLASETPLIYPNPTPGKVCIPDNYIGATITDITGRLMSMVQAKESDIGSYPAGVYFIRKGSNPPQKVIKY